MFLLYEKCLSIVYLRIRIYLKSRSLIDLWASGWSRTIFILGDSTTLKCPSSPPAASKSPSVLKIKDCCRPSFFNWSNAFPESLISIFIASYSSCIVNSNLLQLFENAQIMLSSSGCIAILYGGSSSVSWKWTCKMCTINYHPWF